MVDRTFPNRVTMVRRLVNAQCENLLSCDSQLALPEVIAGGWKGYAEMTEEELKEEYASMFNFEESDEWIEEGLVEPDPREAGKYDDYEQFHYFFDSQCGWPKEFAELVEKEKE